MKNGLLILTAIALLTGCVARKMVTIPAKAAVKTTGKVTVGATKAVIPNGDEKK